jgi:hypothetical protein
MCRDMTIENAPVMFAELFVHTCNSTSAGSEADKWVALTRDYRFGTAANGAYIPMYDVYWLDKPYADAQQNSGDYYGVRIPGIQQLSDIDQLTLGIDGPGAGDRWCVDRVSLAVNGIQVFTKSFPNGLNFVAGGAQKLYVVATEAELRAAYANASRNALCGLPSSITYQQLQRQVEGIYGDVISRVRLADTVHVPNADDFGTWWGSGGGVTITRLNDNAAKIRMQFRVQENEVAGWQATVVVEMEARMSCNYTVHEATGSSTSGWDIRSCTTNFSSPVVLTSVNATADTVIPIVDTIVEGFAEHAVIDSMTEMLSQFGTFDRMFNDAEQLACGSLIPAVNGILCDDGGEICGCPGITFDSTGIRLGWSSFGFRGANLTAPPAPPDLMCLR